MGNNTRINYQTYMEYSTHVNKYSIMNIANTNASHKTSLGNIIKKSPVKGMRDLIWAETSIAVNDDPWFNVRRLVLLPVDNSVSDSVRNLINIIL